jgi:ATP-dependent Clp protease ATP-binding subunit ClpA
MYPFERFSERAKQTLMLAQAEAEASHHSYIGTEHLLLGLLQVENAVGGAALRELGMTLDEIRGQVETLIEKGRVTDVSEIVPTSRVKRVIERSFENAREGGRATVDTGDLLVGLLEETDGVAARVLLGRGVTLDGVRAELAKLGTAGEREPSSRKKPGAPVFPAGPVGEWTRAGPGESTWALTAEVLKGAPMRVIVVFAEQYDQGERRHITDAIRAALKSSSDS